VQFVTLGAVARAERHALENGRIEAGERVEIGAGTDIALGQAAGQTVTDGLRGRATLLRQIVADCGVLRRAVDATEHDQATGRLAVAGNALDRAPQHGLDRLPRRPGSGQRHLERAEALSLLERLLAARAAPTLVLAGRRSRLGRMLAPRLASAPALPPDENKETMTAPASARCHASRYTAVPW